jgi:hypothetical protein
MIPGLLVIVPCGHKKIWDRNQNAGPTKAQDAYTGVPFVVNREFAQHFGERWMILSAKYGFIDPDFVIAGPYNVTFKRPSTRPVSTVELQKQVRRLKPNQFPSVIGLGGKEYRNAITEAFEDTSVDLRFPFAGLPIGKAMQGTVRAIKTNQPVGDPLPMVGSKSRRRKPTAATSIVRRRAVMHNSPAADGNVNEICDRLHKWFNSLPAFRFPFDDIDLPDNGIYVLFEEGEHAHGNRRIVRVGSHTGTNQLRSRLIQHFVSEVKDRSIFRKNVGRCLLNRDNDPFLASWELDLTSRDARVAYAGKIDFAKQKEIECQVSEYIRSHFTFVVFEIPDKDKRIELESKITSTISLCTDCVPSKKWLGCHSPKAKIRESGLWQVNELYKMPLSDSDISDLQRSVPASGL